jgi:hypothetical protein
MIVAPIIVILLVNYMTIFGPEIQATSAMNSLSKIVKSQELGMDGPEPKPCFGIAKQILFAMLPMAL